MSTRYLLPCQCGTKLPVETTQAGQIIRCGCGREIEVPTLLKLRLLETVQEESRTVARRSWGVAEGLCIVGAVIMLGAIAGLVFFYIHRPVPPEAVFTERIVEQDVDKLTLLQADNLWEQLRQGLGGSGPAGPAYREALKTYRISRYATMGEAYRAATKQYHIRIGVTLVILGLATATTICGLVMARTRARRASREQAVASSP